MPNYLEMLRLKNLLDPNQAGMDMPEQGGYGGNMPPLFPGSMDSGNVGMPRQPSPFDDVQFGNTRLPPPGVPALSNGPNDYDVNARMQELFHPSHVASDKFDQMLGQYPQREQPSKKRQWGGALLGALTAAGDVMTVGRDTGRGRKVYDDVTGKTRYEENVQDWKNQIGPSGQAANFERYANTNDRQTATSTVNAELRDRQIDNTLKTNEEKIANSNKRTQIMDYKAKNPNAKIYAPKGGNVMIMNPANGQMTDTGIPTGSLSEMDKINLQAEDRAEAIDEKGRQDRLTAGVKGDEARKTRATAPGRLPTNAAGKPIPPSQVRIQQHDAARQFAMQNPEMGKYIKFGPGQNDFDVVSPGENHWYSSVTRPSQEEYDQIVSSIYGDNVPISQPGRSTKTQGGPPVNSPNMGTRPLSKSTAPSHIQAKTPKGWKYVPKAGGGYTAVPDTGVDTGAQ